MRKTLSQELLRLGTAQARAADEQIQAVLVITFDDMLKSQMMDAQKSGWKHEIFRILDNSTSGWRFSSILSSRGPAFYSGQQSN